MSTRYSLLTSVWAILLCAGATCEAWAEPNASGLIWHLDATRGVSAVSGRVTSWQDSSGWQAPLTSSGGWPTLVTDGSDIPHVRLNTAADLLQAEQPVAVPIAAEGRTLIALLAGRGSASRIGLFSSECEGDFALARTTDGRLGGALGCLNALQGDTANPRGNWQLMMLRAVGGKAELWLDGMLISRSDLFSSAPEKLGLAQTDLAMPGFLKMSELRLYNRALSADEVNALHRYFGGRYFNSEQRFPPILPADLLMEFMPLHAVMWRDQLDPGQSILHWAAPYADACELLTDNSALQPGFGAQALAVGAQAKLTCWNARKSTHIANPPGLSATRVSWTDASPEAVAHQIHLGIGDGPVNFSVPVSINEDSHTLWLAPGRYRVWMSSVDRSGTESPFSNPIEFEVDGALP